jgi:hypothetical protein
MMKIILWLCATTLLLLSGPLHAKKQKPMSAYTPHERNSDKEGGTNKVKTKANPDFSARFQQHEANHILYTNNGDAYDAHLDAQVSLRYVLSEVDTTYEGLLGGDDNVSISYTGGFDFYVGSLESGPVHNTLFNPAINVTSTNNAKDGFIEYRFSLEHESNGQDVFTENTRDTKAEALRMNNQGMTVEQSKAIANRLISRSSNFVSIGTLYTFNGDDYNSSRCRQELWSCIDMHVKLRVYSFDIEEVNQWELPGQPLPDQRDYQGTSLTFEKSWGLTSDKASPKYGVAFTYVTGEIFQNPFKKSTFKIEAYSNWETSLFKRQYIIPLIIKAQTGYMDELYNFYEKKTRYFAGLQFRF